MKSRCAAMNLTTLEAGRLGHVPKDRKAAASCAVTRSVHAAQDPFRYSVSATSTFARSVRAMASHSFAHRSRVFHEYRCFGLWKSLLATYG